MTALQSLISFGPYALLGFLISQVCDLISSGIKPSEFRVKKWVDDNLYQAIASILILFALVTVGPTLMQALTGESLGVTNCFWAGIGSDSITNALARRKRNIDYKLSQVKEGQV